MCHRNFPEFIRYSAVASGTGSAQPAIGIPERLEWSRGAALGGGAFGVTAHQPAKADSSRRFCHAQTSTSAPMDKVSTLIAISTTTPPVSTDR